MTRLGFPGRGRIRPAIVVLIAAFALGANAAPPSPRSLSEVESAAVEIAAEYLAGGPPALFERLATNHRYRRMDIDRALEELEVRAGPPTGALWELTTAVPSIAKRSAVFSINFPSGLDETLMMTIVREGDGYRVSDLRILSDPVGLTTEDSGLAEARAKLDAAHRSAEKLLLVLGVLAGALAAVSILVRSRSRSTALMTTFAAGVVIAIGVAGAIRVDQRFREPLPKAPGAEAPEDDRLGPLLPMRRAMAIGDETGERRVLDTSVNPSTYRTALLWSAQIALSQLRTKEAVGLLEQLPHPSNIPLAELLRARLAFFRSKEAETVLAYERAINLGPGRDALWYEAAESLMILGFEDRAKRYLDRLNRIGSREASVYYVLSALEASKENVDKAEQLFMRGWNLEPATREEVLGLSPIWELLRRPLVSSTIRLSSASEPTVRSRSMSAHPIRMPSGAGSAAIGEHLRIRIGEQELHVAGGASVAPAETPVMDAGAWLRSERERAIGDLPSLLAASRHAGVLMQPLMRRRILEAAEALAVDNRWSELSELTAGFAPASENVPVQLMLLRGTALRRLRMDHEARQLASSLATNPALDRRSDARQMIEVGEMLAALGSYDPAVRMLQRAGKAREISWLDDRIRQILTDKRLATSYDTKTTPHFEVRYPNDADRLLIDQIARILEAELHRIGKVIPAQSFQPVTVNIVWWEEFRSTYTGSDHILGFYNGKITLPFAGVPALAPEVVAILSHELAHAMIAQATNDQAPRWFQEGLAQRIEMQRYAPNALNMYDDDKLLAVSLIDTVMESTPDPAMMEEAYIESQTIVRYIESQCGSRAIQRMLEAFRTGASTERALSGVCAADMPTFEATFREWGRGKNRVFENPDPIDYGAWMSAGGL